MDSPFINRAEVLERAAEAEQEVQRWLREMVSHQYLPDEDGVFDPLAVQDYEYAQAVAEHLPELFREIGPSVVFAPVVQEAIANQLERGARRVTFVAGPGRNRLSLDERLQAGQWLGIYDFFLRCLQDADSRAPDTRSSDVILAELRRACSDWRSNPIGQPPAFITLDAPRRVNLTLDAPRRVNLEAIAKELADYRNAPPDGLGLASRAERMLRSLDNSIPPVDTLRKRAAEKIPP